MENKKVRLVNAQLGPEVFLESIQKLRLEFHIARLVDTMHVAESSRNCELLRDRAKSGMHQEAICRSGVEFVLADATVVDTILHATRDADLHLKNLVHWGHLFKVLRADTNVLIVGLLGQVKHVGGEKWFTINFEVFLV